MIEASHAIKPQGMVRVHCCSYEGMYNMAGYNSRHGRYDGPVCSSELMAVITWNAVFSKAPIQYGVES